MPRYMDADVFLDLFYVAAAGQDKAFISTVEMVVDDVLCIDTVEVVRCKECIHYDSRKFLPCTRLGLFVTDEFFCGVGKKAEEVINDGDL